MIYRFLSWVKNILAEYGLVNNRIMCQMCGKMEDYNKTAVINIKNTVGVNEMLICSECANYLEAIKSGGKK